VFEVTKGVIPVFVTVGKNPRQRAVQAAARVNVVGRACLAPVVE